MPRTTPTSGNLHALLVGLADLADRGRPPHPGGRPCGGLCVPACAAGPREEPPTDVRRTRTRGGRP